ncbi:MAG: TIGR03936 family radical SAM-associated protein [Halanaerobiaceae bacterium]
MLIRAKFEKLDSVKYISHLELMDTFRRVFRRAGLPLAYSQGYNPHIILSLSQPLKVGMVGRGEYFDLELSEDISPKDFIKSVNQKMPEGIKILEAKKVPENIKSLMAVINTAVYVYDIKLTENAHSEKELIQKFLKKENIEIIRHRRNKKDKKLDIRPLIHDAEKFDEGKWAFRVQCGSAGNLRAEEVIRALSNYYDEFKYIPLINIEREGLFVNIGDEFYSPLDDKVIGS